MSLVLTTPTGQPGSTFALATEDGQSIPGVTQPVTALGNVLSPDFILQPSGTAGGNVYVDWPSMYAVASQVGPGVVLWIDPTFAAATIPAGAWVVEGWTFRGHSPLPTGINATLTAQVGCTFVNTKSFKVDGTCTLTTVSTAPVLSSAAWILFLTQGGRVNGGAGAPFFELTAGGTALLTATGNCAIGDATHNAVVVDATATCTANLTAGTVANAHAFGGGGTVAARITSDVTLNATQDVTTLTTTFISLASQDAYTPAVIANWSGTAPTSVANALDRIAAHTGPIP